MSSTPLGLDRIKVQTARMLEIYALLQKELKENTHLSLSAEDQDQISQAIATVEANMRQLQAYFITCREESSQANPEACELEEILTAVLNWVQEEGE